VTRVLRTIALVVLLARPAGGQVTYRPEAVAAARARVRAGDTALKPALDRLLRDAEKALAAPLVAVTDKKTLLPPSNDAHDYFSLSPYWWPDPSKPDGLPYIRRDGETNPESKRDLDQPRVAAMGANAQTLALAWYFTGDERYAERSAAQLRRWFLDPATRMTPHLRFAQLVRGNPNERGSGIIDTRWFIEATDAARLLAGSRSWTAADDRALRAWFAAYLQWLRESPNGKHEHAAKNNHGSWYAAQTAAYALFTGDTAAARAIVAEARPRVGWQITPDGQQPIELERTRSMHYSAFNAEALARVAEIGRRVGGDLWSYQAPEGGSLRKALDHLARYAPEPARWPGQQIDAVELDLLVIQFRRANAALGGAPAPYADVLRRLPADLVGKDRSALLYPDPTTGAVRKDAR
jgi:hypothetical protein